MFSPTHYPNFQLYISNPPQERSRHQTKGAHTPWNNHYKKWESIKIFLKHEITEDYIKDGEKSGWIKKICNQTNLPYLGPHISRLHNGRNEEQAKRYDTQRPLDTKNIFFTKMTLA